MSEVTDRAFHARSVLGEKTTYAGNIRGRAMFVMTLLNHENRALSGRLRYASYSKAVPD